MERNKYSEISQTDTDEKIGEFWDNHDLTDFDTDAPDIEFEISALPASWGKLYNRLQIFLWWVTARIKTY